MAHWLVGETTKVCAARPGAVHQLSRIKFSGVLGLENDLRSDLYAPGGDAINRRE
jgi:hypothetical protein